MKLVNAPLDLAGRLKITCYDKNDNIISQYEDNNKIIIPTIRKFAEHMLGLKEYEDNSLFEVKLGDGGTDENGAMKEVTGKESNLGNPINSYQFYSIPGNLTDTNTAQAVASTIQIITNEKDDVSYTVILSFTSKDANMPGVGGSVQYSEIGLFLENGDMFAYKTFPSQVKDDSTRISVEWTFNFFANKRLDNDDGAGGGGEEEGRPPIIPTKTIDVTYEPNGGEPQEATVVKIKKGTKFKMEENKYIRNGYIFESWCLNPKGTARTYNAGETVEFYTDMTFYAKWVADRKEKVNFIFKYEGMSTIIEVVKNSEFTFTNKYYDFIGPLPDEKEFWKWVNEDTGDEYEIGNKVTASKSMTFIVKLKDKQPTE